MTSLLLGASALAAISVALSWAWARWWCMPRRERSSPTLAAAGLPLEPVDVRSGGARLRAWFLPAPAPASGAAVVLAHGWSKSSADLLPLAEALHGAGLGVLAFDARGHGESDGDGPITILKLAEDVLAAFHALQGRPEVDADRLGVVGHSIGGGAALLAASVEPRIRAVVSSSAFTDPDRLTREVMRRMRIPRAPFGGLVVRFIEGWMGSTMAAVAPVNRIALVEGRVLLVHGGSDRFVSPSHMEELYASARRDRAERLLVPGRGHGSVLEAPACQRAIADFLVRSLGRSGERRGSEPDAELTRAFRALLPQLGACC